MAILTAALLLVCGALPLVSENEIRLAAAHSAATLQRETGGFTYSLRRGSLGGINAYAVAILPERSVVVGGKAGEREIAAFIESNLDVLRDSQFSVGGWFDRSSNQTYLDISMVVRSRNLAVSLGRAYNQKAVLHLRTLQEINTCGNGATRPAAALTAESVHHLARHVRVEDLRRRVLELRARNAAPSSCAA